MQSRMLVRTEDAGAHPTLRWRAPAAARRFLLRRQSPILLDPIGGGGKRPLAERISISLGGAALIADFWISRM
jgi:hypothetical protein